METGESLRAFALIARYSHPDMNLFRESVWTVYLVTQIPYEEGLVIVEATSILSVVSMQPHSHKLIPGEARFFVWEKMGLKMALLSSSDLKEIEDIED